MPRQTLWSIRWGTAKLEYSTEGRAGGTMDKVDGSFFMKGKPASAFRAGHGEATVQNKNLTLSGGVFLKSSNPDSTLSCNSILWNAATELIEAHGTVYVTMEALTFGPFEELIASPDLKEISTPGLANKTK